MAQKLISNGLWLDSNAEQAVTFYQSVFPDSKVNLVTYYGKAGQEMHRRPEGSVMAINFELCGQSFQAINGGPVFKINPAISYFIICETEEETNRLWDALMVNGKEMMPLDKYDWSPRYGWLEDQYGVSWQIYQGQPNDENQKICPSLLFVGEQHGRAEEAVHFYTSVFKNSEIQGILKYPAGGMDPEGTVMHSQFKLGNQVFMAMDSAADHQFQFNEAISLIVNCETQEEIDYYWDKLIDGGEPSECGWLKDQFGVSWQIVPSKLDKMIADQDKEKKERVLEAMFGMVKLDLAKLEEAYNQ